ncbi:hypothetical protein A9P82_10130 [Arachidicoccus ginsenosidimutans]|uniref:RNA polymerase sigma factor n=1 Tax=Arachidicoccus sp. BS20 TaxID=1850526 RepID=UPI0007F0688B|nr:RNA polymerase sigma-70 factor [Arachidicoccus sp. BS20]ANI89615.1 hypothetical protein A9P82_10130 [Arachidicoccus sp. BS20]
MDEHYVENNRLLALISNSDESAFEKLFFMYKNLVYSIALAYTESQADAEEIVQDVFSRIWNYRHNLGAIKNFSAWINTVTRNRSLTILKKRAIEYQRKEDYLSSYFHKETNSTEQYIEDKELQILFEDMLNRLSPQQRKIFELSRIQGQDRKTIAKNLGLSQATVSAHLTIALRTVRTFLYNSSNKIVTCLFALFLFAGKYFF